MLKNTHMLYAKKISSYYSICVQIYEQNLKLMIKKLGNI